MRREVGVDWFVGSLIHMGSMVHGFMGLCSLMHWCIGKHSSLCVSMLQMVMARPHFRVRIMHRVRVGV